MIEDECRAASHHASGNDHDLHHNMPLASCLAALLLICPALRLRQACAPARWLGITPPKPAPGVFFVATNGNDSWSGRLPAPNPEGTDGPFETLSHAVQAVRGYQVQSGQRRGRTGRDLPRRRRALSRGAGRSDA